MIAGRVGISPAGWENMTPSSFRAYVKGYLEEQRYQNETRQRQDYNLAVMVRAAIGEKRMPGYDRFYSEQKKHGKRAQNMSDDQMFQQVLALNKALGGTVNGE